MHKISQFGEHAHAQFIITNDEGMGHDMSAIYNHITKKKSSKVTIYISLESTKVWISANSICNLLVFIENILINKSNVTIKIDLFEKDILNHMRSLEKIEELNPDEKAFTGKLRFYHRWDIANQIYRIQKYYRENQLSENSVDCYPSNKTFGKLLTQFKRYVYFDESKFSTTLMPMSALDDDELTGKNKIRADKRIKNLTVILWTHFHGHDIQTLMNENVQTKEIKHLRKVRHLSAVLMYELIKNIYQHSNIKSSASILGYATVQMNKRSTLNAKNNTYFPTLKYDKSHNKVNLFAMLSNENIGEKYASDAVRYLSISICDFGQGIIESIKGYFLEKNYDEKFEDIELLRKALFTPFTVKHGSSEKNRPEFYYTADEKILLSQRGFGWITAAIFIASQMGTFNVTTGNLSITYRTTIEGCNRVLNLLNTNRSVESAETLFKKYEDVFEENIKILPDTLQTTGTRILIEIPLIYKWFKQDKKFRYRKYQSFNS